MADKHPGKYLRFGILCRFYRGRERLTQPQAAQKIGMSIKAYKDVEAAKHEPRGHNTLLIKERTGWPLESNDLATWMTPEAVKQLLGEHE